MSERFKNIAGHIVDTKDNVQMYAKHVLEMLNGLDKLSNDRFKEMGRLQNCNCDWNIKHEKLKQENEKLKKEKSVSHKTKEVHAENHLLRQEIKSRGDNFNELKQENEKLTELGLHAANKIHELKQENEKLRECVNIIKDDYAKRKKTYGWHDLLIHRINDKLREITNSIGKTDGK